LFAVAVDAAAAPAAGGRRGLGAGDRLGHLAVDAVSKNLAG
jgi:hypothetical protein